MVGDDDGAAALAEGLGLPLEQGRIYAGQAGATRWPSGITGAATLQSRIGRNHLHGRIRGSTFRLTLAAILLKPEKLFHIGPKTLDPQSEQALSVWMAKHLELALHPFADPDPIEDLEDRVLARIDPPLNLEGMPRTIARQRLSELRATLASAPSDER